MNRISQPSRCLRLFVSVNPLPVPSLNTVRIKRLPIGDIWFKEIAVDCEVSVLVSDYRRPFLKPLRERFLAPANLDLHRLP